MKSTMTMRAIANPQRTTLAHLRDTAGLAPGVTPLARADELPDRTANPRRTVVTEQHESAQGDAAAAPRELEAALRA
ncbi:hypothetical protein [Streptomyces sp. 6N223]|uniref:hypothetical protein n=1 Tax=Streptomyces sp. 6N223 TaxID=3457412 RepID=UPI003FD1992C